MKLQELFEQLSWNTQQHNDDFVVLNVNVEDVFNNAHKDFTLNIDDETGGTNAIGNRLSKAKQHFDDNQPMDLPQVGYNKWNKYIEFTDGRHRTLAARQKGYDYIPMLVATQDLDEFKKLVRTKDAT